MASASTAPRVAFEKPAWLQRFEKSLARRRTGLLVGVIGINLFIRAVLLTQFLASPLALLHTSSGTDMAVFHEWATDIARGDLLSKNVSSPMHSWHYLIADHYLGGGGSAADSARARDLWQSWLGSHRFYQDPGYPYFVALVYRLFGPSPPAVFLLQLLLGILVAVGLYLITERLYGPFAALCAAAFYTLYSPLLVFEVSLLRDHLVMVVGILFLWLVSRNRNGWREWVVIGLVLGISLALKSTFLLLLLITIAILFVTVRPRSIPVRCTLALAAGAAVAVLPVIMRNAWLRVPLFGWASANAANFVMANSPGGIWSNGFGTYDHVAEIVSRHHDLTPALVASTLALHGSLLDYFRMEAGKLLTIFHWYEFLNNVNYYLFREYLPILRWLPLSFGVIGPLGLLGLGLSIRWWREHLWIYALFLVHLISLLGFFVYARFRAPLVPVLMILAGLAVTRLVIALSRPFSPRKLVLPLVSLAILGIVVNRPLPISEPLITPSDWAAVYSVYYLPRSEELSARGEKARAAEVLARSLDHEPAYVRALGNGNRPITENERDLARAFGVVHQIYSDALRQTGNARAAALEQARAEELTALAE